MPSATPMDYTFMGHLQNIYYYKEVVDEQGIKEMLGKFNALTHLVHHTLPVFYVIDYTKYQYLFMTEACKPVCGYDAREFLDGGLDMLIHIYQKDDFRVYNENVFKANAAFLQSTQQEEHHKYVFSYNFRAANNKGKLISVLQRGSYITSKDTGLPLFSLGMIIDITSFKRDTLIYHNIEKADWNEGVMHSETVCTNYFYPNHEDTILTRQEKRVLQWMSEGYSSKQIADKLFISENTVANHRKNMLKKTNTKNVAELVAFAIRNQII